MDKEGEFAKYVSTLSETLAALGAPQRAGAKHQSMHHFVAKAEWSDAALLAAVREEVLPALGTIQAWIVDDTGYPKKGTHSVGVARQYCGQLGKQDNCQVAVSVSLANEAFSLPLAYRLYLPLSWATDVPRRRQGKVPDTLKFATKPAIALQLLEQLQATAKLPELVIADAGY